MEIKLEENGKKGRAFVEVEDEVLGEMDYSRAGSQLLIIHHTEVDESLRGQGAGRQMLNKIVDYARQNDLSIMPLCPYAKSVFDKDSSIHDVLKKKNKD